MAKYIITPAINGRETLGNPKVLREYNGDIRAVRYMARFVEPMLREVPLANEVHIYRYANILNPETFTLVYKWTRQEVIQ